MLADDFTGAGDVALAFWRAGWRVAVNIPAGPWPGRPPPGVNVWVLDTESRSRPPAQAAARVKRAMNAFRRWRAEFFFKKIDSTLRGPLGAELLAFLDRAPLNEPVALVPAFPRLGRTTRGGKLYVNGRPLHLTAAGRDPRNPVRSSRVLDAVGPSLTDRVWVPDVANARSLRGAARRAACGTAAVGSGGFAEAVARVWGGTRRRFREPVRRGGFAPVGVAVGSAHPRSRAQLKALTRRLSGGPNVGVVRVFHTPGARGEPGDVMARMATSANVRGRGIHRWVLTGGETAFHLARLWRKPRWRIEGEIEPGVPLARSGQLRAVLKPGGFGSQEVLWKACRRLASI